MTETTLDNLVMGFASFFFGIIGDIISFCVTITLFCTVYYLFVRYFVCQNDKEQYAEFNGNIRAGIKDIAESFKAVMPAVKESAKCWAKEKLEELKDEWGN